VETSKRALPKPRKPVLGYGLGLVFDLIRVECRPCTFSKVRKKDFRYSYTNGIYRDVEMQFRCLLPYNLTPSHFLWVSLTERLPDSPERIWLK
jgi:hypothetical protein